MSDRHDEILRGEIRSRLDSREWNSSIARGVLAKRKKIVRKRIAAACASIVLLVTGYLALPWGTGVAPVYDQMVSAQVNGTYRQVFTGGEAGASASSGSTETLFGDIDTLVDNALARR